MMGYTISAWVAVAGWLLLFGLTMFTARRVHTHTPPQTALAVFLQEDCYDRTIRETGINPATIDTVLSPIDWREGIEFETFFKRNDTKPDSFKSHGISGLHLP
jgi:hypothetical protein